MNDKTDLAMLRLLKSIDESIGVVAKSIGKERSMETKGSGGKGDKKDPLGKETTGLLKSFKSLSASSDKLEAANRAVAEATTKNALLKQKTNDGLDKLTDSLKKQKEENDTFLKSTGDATKNLDGMISGIKEQMSKSGELFDENGNLSEALSKLTDDVSLYTDLNKGAAQEIGKLSYMVNSQAESGKSLNDIVSDNVSTFAALHNNLKEYGFDTEFVSKAVQNAGNSAEDFVDTLTNAQGRLQANSMLMESGVSDFAKSINSNAASQLAAARSNAAKIQNEYDKNIKVIKDHTDRFFKTLGAGISTFLVRMNNVLVNATTTGFETGGFEGIWDTLANSFKMGASPEEAQRFAAQNRDVLTSITNSAMLSAGEGLKAVEGYGDVVKDTFGAVGQQQLQMVGQGITALSSMGVRASQENFTAFTQGIENMAKTSNKTADELFSEFADMADDPNFQGMLMSIGSNANATTMLSDSFTLLQGSVGLNADEFMKYRKQLAAERSRTGVDRVVQAAFVGQLAGQLGFAESDQELLSQGKAYYESLSKDDRDLYDIKYNQLRESVAQERALAIQQGDTQRLQQLDIMTQQGNIEALIGPAMRKEAGVPQAVAKNQQERILASKQNTEAVLMLANSLKEFSSGLAASPIGQAITMGGIISLATSVGVARGLRGSKLFDTGIKGLASGGGLMGGKSGALIKGAGALGAAFMIAQGGLAAYDAVMKSSGDNFEKSLLGMSTFVDEAFMGLPGLIAGGFTNLINKATQIFTDSDTLGGALSSWINGEIGDGPATGAELEAERNRMREQALDELMADKETRMQILENKKRRDAEEIAKSQQDKEKVEKEDNTETKALMKDMVVAQVEQTAENKKQTSALTGIKDKKDPDKTLLSASTPGGR